MYLRIGEDIMLEKWMGRAVESLWIVLNSVCGPLALRVRILF